MFRAEKEIFLLSQGTKLSHIWETFISSGELKVWSAPELLVGPRDHLSSFTPNSHRTLECYRTQTATVEVGSGSLLQSGWSTGVKRNDLFNHKCSKVISERLRIRTESDETAGVYSFSRSGSAPTVLHSWRLWTLYTTFVLFWQTEIIYILIIITVSSLIWWLFMKTSYKPACCLFICVFVCSVKISSSLCDAWTVSRFVFTAKQTERDLLSQ